MQKLNLSYVTAKDLLNFEKMFAYQRIERY